MGCCSSACRRLPTAEELKGEWWCDEAGMEFTIAPRADGRLHYANSASHIACLEPMGAAYTGIETSWNGVEISFQVKLVPRGSELQFFKWEKAPFVLRRLSAAEAAARGRYAALASLWEALAEGHTVLLKGSWLLELHRAAAVLPRRQELPPGATWEPTELQHAVEAGTVRLVGLSYCWKDPDHPDPQGEQLGTVAALIERRLAHTYPDGTRVLEDLAVFWDYPSLFQPPRSDPEQEAFDRGLITVDLWYAHRATEAWLLTRVPPGSRPYNERGWPVFERAVCDLLTPGDSLLDVGLWQGGGEAWAEVARRCRAQQREPPMRPERADELLRTKIFTSGADFERVRRIYERTYREVLGSVRVLKFADFPGWGDHEAKALAECLPDCPQLEELNLGADRIGAAGAAALGSAAAQCGRLRIVDMTGNPLGDEGAAALLKGLADCPALESLYLTQTGIQDRGAEAIAAVLPRCRALCALLVEDCRISDAGAAALGAVLAQCPALKELEIDKNQLTTEGKAALKAAWAASGKRRGACIV